MKHFPALIVLICLTSCEVFACTCGSRTYAQIKAHNDTAIYENKIFVLIGKVIQKIPVHGQDVPDMVNVKIYQYWGSKKIQLRSDTLTIMDSPFCPEDFHLDSTYVIKGYFQNFVFKSGKCSGNEKFNKSALDSLKILGAGYKMLTPERKSITVTRWDYNSIFLGFSIVLNIILLFVIVRRKEGS
jgi:hypothetical protein